MLYGDINLFFLLFFLLFFTLFFNNNTALHFLLTAELLWITLYLLVGFVGIIYDNINILSLTFFFLVFSAIEFSVGLILLLIQNLFNRSLNLNNYEKNYNKFFYKYRLKIYKNKLFWKI